MSLVIKLSNRGSGLPADPLPAERRMLDAIDSGDLDGFISAAIAFDTFTKSGAPGSWDMTLGGRKHSFRGRTIIGLAEVDPFMPGHVGMVQELVRRGLDLNELKDKSGLFYNGTALTSAIRSGSAQMVGALIALGSDPNAMISLGQNTVEEWTPLRTLLADASPMADRFSVSDKLKALLDGGASMAEMTRRSNMDPLEVAIPTGRWSVVHALLEIGEDPNVPLKCGETALELAAREKPDLHATMSAWLAARSAARAIDEMQSSASLKSNHGTAAP